MGTKLFKTMNIDGVDQLVLATSYSQIEAYLNCPYRWKLDYLLGKRESVSFFNGVKNGKEITLGEAHDMLDFNLDVNEIPYASKDNQVMAEQQHHAMIEGLVSGTNELAKFIEDKEVVACEKEFRLPVDLPFVVCYAGNKYSRIYINGFIDFIVKDKEGNIYVTEDCQRVPCTILQGMIPSKKYCLWQNKKRTGCTNFTRMAMSKLKEV